MTGERGSLWRSHRLLLAAELAAAQGGVVSRTQLREVGITHRDVRTECAARRWSAIGRHTVLIGDVHATHAGTRQPMDLDPARIGPQGWPARAWWAVWESGSGALLDGTSALRAAGLSGFEDPVLHVTCPRGACSARLDGVRHHWSRSAQRGAGGGPPRVPTDVAVIHAAQWARSDRQAALLIAMPVQQRLVPTGRLLHVWRQISRSPRRAIIDSVIRDVCDGAQAMSELNFAGLCRRWRLPAPTRQAVRIGRRGRVYLDVWWQEAGLVVEIEGAHHVAGMNAIDDALRQNDLTLTSSAVLRIPVLGLRLEPARFMSQVACAYARRVTSVQ